MTTTKDRIPPSDFGRDHWSLLAYVETLVVDGQGGIGRMDLRRLRCNPKTHPWGAGIIGAGMMTDAAWKDEYSTRLAGHAPETPHQANGHDDWDCLDDLEEAGLLDVWSTANALVSLTLHGVEVAAAVRAHKANGGNFAGFTLAASA